MEEEVKKAVQAAIQAALESTNENVDEISKMVANVSPRGVIVQEDEVCFDAKGQATISNAEANTFIRETLLKEGAIGVTSPAGFKIFGINIFCGSGGTNVYCPTK
jgi:hypothetical protein